MLKPNQLLQKGQDKIKVLGICGEVIFTSTAEDHENASKSYETEKQLADLGWLPVAEKWVPTPNKKYYFVDSTGETYQDIWHEAPVDVLRFSFGNVHSSRFEAEQKRDKMRDC